MNLARSRLFIFGLICIGSHASLSASAGEAFHGKLQAFLGRWEGSCTLSPPYLGENEMPMRWALIPHKTKAGSRAASYLYQIDYGTNDHRTYELLSTESKTRFTLDEHNGIFIEVNATSKSLGSTFVVEGKHIETRFELSSCQSQCHRYWDDRLQVKMWRLSEDCVQSNAHSDTKDACPILSMQDCILSRVNPVDSPQL